MYGDFDDNLLMQWCELYDRFVTKDRQRLAAVVRFCSKRRLDEHRLKSHDILSLLTKSTLEDDDYLSAYGCLSVLDRLFWHKHPPQLLNGVIEVPLKGTRYILTCVAEHPIAKAIPKNQRFQLNAEIGVNHVLCLRHQWQAIEHSAKIDMSRSEVFDVFVASSQKQVNIGLSPFAGIGDMSWRYGAEKMHDGSIPFWCDGAQNEDALWERLCLVLAAARERKVHILLFPELVMTEVLQTKLRAWLLQYNAFEPIIRLVVAGTRHVIDVGGHNAYANRCTVLNHCGGIEWEQEKRQPFVMTVEEASEFFGIQSSASEFTQLSQYLIMRHTALGRMATPICLDFLCDDQWKLMPVDVYLVPAMSAGLSRFRDTCRTVGNLWGAAAFVCNVPMDDERHSVLAYRPAKDALQIEKESPSLFIVKVDIDMN
ncbi:MAG: hypothetical protein NTY50_07580 [Methylobacter sp.]|nr:hypothetical protein [Methylobacter sp.]